MAVRPGAAAAAAASGPTWRACLSCHEDAGLSMTTAKGEKVSLAVTAAELAGSAHRGVECRGCHPGVKLDAHPDGHAVASLDEFRRAASRACLACHPAERLRARSQHAAVVFEDQQLSCVECHGSHGVKSVAAWKRGARAQRVLPDLPLPCPHASAPGRHVDGARGRRAQAQGLRAPGPRLCRLPHRVLDERAPRRRRSASGTIAPSRPSGTCARCHADKLRQAEGSVHFTLLRSGAKGAPGCTDCHSAHEVAPKERFATLAGTPCRACHAQIFAAYAGSMHGKARASGDHFDAPLCSDCHRAHDVQGSARPELVRAACIGCHPTAVAIHSAWLPNATLAPGRRLLRRLPRPAGGAGGRPASRRGGHGPHAHRARGRGPASAAMSAPRSTRRAAA